MTLGSHPRIAAGRQALLSALLALISTAAMAESPPSSGASVAATVWQCDYDFGATIYCRVANAPASNEPATLKPAVATSPDGDADVHALPRLVTMIHEAPSQLANRRIAIPIFRPTRNVALAHDLADAVVCNAQPACRVEFVTTKGSARDTIASR